MLNISARNWMLNVSEILLMWVFLNTEKSRFAIPGATRIFRPALPRRLKHANGGSQGVGGLPMKLFAGLTGSNSCPRLGGSGSQFAIQVFKSGTVGTEKHVVLM